MQQSWLSELAFEANGRYFTPRETARITEYVESLPRRLDAAKKVEDAHKWLAKQMAEPLARQAQAWGIPKDPFSGDFMGMLPMMVCAMVNDDNRLLNGSIIQPLLALSNGLDIPMTEITPLFHRMQQLLSERFPEEATTLVQPVFEHLMAVLHEMEPESFLV